MESYHADNGVFKANAFVSHIRKHNQKLSYYVVNVHHKNAIAERAIWTVSQSACALLLHATIHWKHGINSLLWPLAVTYATYLYNHLPTSKGIAPADLFTGQQVRCHQLLNCHTWGCPVNVLDPTLANGKKLPRWEPCSRRGVFVGFNRHHSSDMPLVLNLETDSISPQYHVVLDDAFSTVPSLAVDDTPPNFWTSVDLTTDAFDSLVYRVPLDPSSPISHDPLFMTPSELEEKARSDARAIFTSKIHLSFWASLPLAPPPMDLEEVFPMLPSSPVQSYTSTVPPTAAPSALPTPSQQGTVSFADNQSSSLRCSSLANKGAWKSLCYAEEYSNQAQNAAALKSNANFTAPMDYVDQVFCTSISNPLHDFHTLQLAYAKLTLILENS